MEFRCNTVSENLLRVPQKAIEEAFTDAGSRGDVQCENDKKIFVLLTNRSISPITFVVGEITTVVSIFPCGYNSET